MSREGRISRIYTDVQKLIYDFIKQDMKPTTQQLQNMIFSSSYNEDSRKQKDDIYGCIMRGRENVIKLWDTYIEDNDHFNKQIAYIEYYKPETVRKELESQDFKEFYDEMQHKRFGEDTQEIMKYLGKYPAIAILFNQKMREYSEQGHSFLISSGGKNASWFIPSWWTWNVREYDLYRRTLSILRTQLQRGIDTKVLMPSNISLEKTSAMTTVVRAMIENDTVWTCPKCDVRNLESSANCANCGTLKGE